MWSEQQQSSQQVVSGNPTYNNTSAAALLSYDVAHSIPWDWRVSLYTWTKGIASGVYLVAALLVLLGFLSPVNVVWLWVTPIVSGAFLGMTGLLLIWDLEHPTRFYMIFTRAQWRSWLVRGAFIIGAYSLVLAIHFVGSILHSTSIQQWLMTGGIPLSVLTAIYTAYLFAQAKARDLWQNPLLPPHLLVQALVLGAIILLTVVFLRGIGTDSKMFDALVWILVLGTMIHLLCVIGEISLTHSTAHAHLAVYEMVWGRYRKLFWLGLGLTLIAILAFGLAMLVQLHFIDFSSAVAGLSGAAVPAVAIGLLLHEHAYVQAGQSVPLA